MLLDNGIIKGLKVTVMGLGVNGGGSASAEFFAERGAAVTVTDLKTESDLLPSVQKLRKYPNVNFVLGEHRIEDFENADLVIKNPGVKSEGNPFLKKAEKIESDISVFLSLSKAPVLAVTGSKGKSSTASALHYGLKELGYNAFLGGNITVSPLTFIEKTTNKTPVVLELSSWQLADLKNSRFFKPEIAIITPVMPDHQNWYGNMEAYVADKKIIYKNQNLEDFTICNYDDGWGKVFAEETKGEVFWYGEKKLPDGLQGVFQDGGKGFFVKKSGEIKQLLPENTKVPGTKMKQNLLNAAAALVLYGAEEKNIMRIMENYPGIEHRMEFFHEHNGIRFYNDTAATIPEAAAAALEAFNKPPLLICGGTDKSLDFSCLAKNAFKAKKIFLLKGSGTDKLIPLLEKNGIHHEGVFSSLDSLLLKLKESAAENSNVILSPGASSFEMFKNEFDRGIQFKEKVRRIFS